MSSNVHETIESDTRGLKHHHRHYLPDGNLIIIVEDTVFRVYGGLLAQRSSVFADMQGIPQPTTADMVDGVPSVTLSGDLSTDFSLLLSALLDPIEGDEWTFEQVLGVLRVGNKYLFESVVKWANRRLKKHTPSLANIKQWTQLHREPYWSLNTSIAVIKAARQFTLPLIFESVAFYSATVLIHQNLRLLGVVANIHPIDLQRLLDGRRKLQTLLCEMTPKIMELSRSAVSKPCSSCLGSRLAKSEALMGRLMDDPLRALLDIERPAGLFIFGFGGTRNPCLSCGTSRAGEPGEMAKALFDKLCDGALFGKHEG